MKGLVTFTAIALATTAAVAGYNDTYTDHQQQNVLDRGYEIRAFSDNTLNQKFDITTPYEQEMARNGYADSAYDSSTKYDNAVMDSQDAKTQVITDYERIPEDTAVVLAGIVTDIDMIDNEFTIRSGSQEIDVETDRTLVLSEGDRVLVNGMIDYDWGEREISAISVVDETGTSMLK